MVEHCDGDGGGAAARAAIRRSLLSAGALSVLRWVSAEGLDCVDI